MIFTILISISRSRGDEVVVTGICVVFFSQNFLLYCRFYCRFFLTTFSSLFVCRLQPSLYRYLATITVTQQQLPSNQITVSQQPLPSNHQRYLATITVTQQPLTSNHYLATITVTKQPLPSNDNLETITQQPLPLPTYLATINVTQKPLPLTSNYHRYTVGKQMDIKPEFEKYISFDLKLSER